MKKFPIIILLKKTIILIKGGQNEKNSFFINYKYFSN